MFNQRSPKQGLRALDDQETAIPVVLQVAGGYSLPLYFAAGATFVALLLNGGAQFWTAAPLNSALLGLQFFVSALLALAGHLCTQRAGAARDISRRNQELSTWKLEVERAKNSKTDVVSRYYTPSYNLIAFGKFIIWAPFFAALAGALAAFLAIRALVMPVPDLTVYGPLGGLDYLAAFVNFVLAFGCVALGSYLRGQSSGEFPEARALAAWLKALQWSSLFVALVSLARILNFDNVAVILQFADAWLGRVLLLVVLAVALEQTVIAALASVAKRRDYDTFTLPFSASLGDNLFVSPRILAETLATLEAKLGLNVRSSYVVARLRRLVPFVGTGVFVLLWFSTCFFMVGTEETGVLTRFGRPIRDAPLGSGLHFKMPFPVDTIRTVASERVKIAVVGAPLDTSKPIMWTKMHATGDYNQVLGQGREVVSVHGRIFYRVKDAQAYLFSAQNPDDEVSSFAYKTIMRQVISRDIDQLLSLDRVGFSEKLKAELQRDLDAQNLGIEVVSFPLVGLHPPVDVAQDYQAVVSAQIASVTSATKANAERLTKVPTAQSNRDVAIKIAAGDGAKRLGRAKGEAAKFDSVSAAYAASPQVYKERLWMETMEDTLAGKKIFIVDHKANSPAPDYTVDLRPAGALP